MVRRTGSHCHAGRIREVLRPLVIAGRDDRYVQAELPLMTHDVLAARAVSTMVVENVVKHMEDANRSLRHSSHSMLPDAFCCRRRGPEDLIRPPVLARTDTALFQPDRRRQPSPVPALPSTCLWRSRQG